MVKNNINLMARDQGLYSQFFMLRRKDMKITEANKNKNEAKFKFQGQSAISQCWFDLDFGWIEVNFITCEPDFYRITFQRHDDKQDTNTFRIFEVPIGNSKCVKKNNFHSNAPMLKYFKKSLNICCFSSLASYFASIEQTNSENAISLSIEKSLKSEVGNIIDFDNAILKNEKQIKCEPRVYYSLRTYKNMGSFKIQKDMSEHVTLVQLMDSLGNLNHAISVFGYWIFDSNYERALVLNRESLDMIFAPSFGEEEVATFETDFVL